MLTLDTAGRLRQQARERILAQRDRERDLLRADIANKEVTVARDGDIATTSLLAQLGTPLASAEFIVRLQKMNRNLVFEVARADESKIGIYVIENRRQADGSMRTVKRFICGMERGFMPERSVRHMKQEEVPDPDIHGHWRKVDVFKKETRGWRTVLTRLLKERLISTSQIERMFPPNLTSRNWQQVTSPGQPTVKG